MRSKVLPAPPKLSRLLALALAAVAAGAVEPEGESWTRLRALPREERVALADRLKVFDALPRLEQDELRALDRQVAALPPEDRANAYSTLRRYHLWVLSLTDSQRAELNALEPSQRMAFVSKLRAEEPDPQLRHAEGLARNAFGGSSPYELATQTRTWLALDAKQKAELSKLADPERSRKLQEFRRELKVAAVSRPPVAPGREEALLKRLRESAGALNSPFAKNLDDPSPPWQEKVKRRLRRLAETEGLTSRPLTKTTSANLLRFDEAMPPWVRPVFDTQPPEEARRQLTLVYRLVFPAPQEMPAPPKPGAAAAKGATPRPPGAAPATTTPPAPGVVPAAPKPAGPAPF